MKAIIIAIVIVIFSVGLFVYYSGLQYSNHIECGVENCHGLDISCGPNVAQICTMEYKFGDICRQYVSCEYQNNQCRLVESLNFKICKQCVIECESKFADINLDQLFSCESACGV
jgi:hypothetical protein